MPVRRHDEFKWKTKDGREIRASKMTDKHLVNTINYLKRTDDGSPSNAKARSELEKEWRRRVANRGDDYESGGVNIMEAL